MGTTIAAETLNDGDRCCEYSREKGIYESRRYEINALEFHNISQWCWNGCYSFFTASTNWVNTLKNRHKAMMKTMATPCSASFVITESLKIDDGEGTWTSAVIDVCGEGVLVVMFVGIILEVKNNNLPI